MAVTARTYYGTIGLSWVVHSELSNVKILGVKRSGVGFDEKISMPAGSERKFYYDSANGKIWFSPDQVFAPNEQIEAIGEYVHVLFKT